MSIASEFQSTAENIQADYEGLENIGADLTGINKNILNIRTILDNIYNDMPKVTGEGTEVTLTPTRKGRLALIPKGNSTQESTTGKQLFNINFTPNSKLIASGVSKTTIDKGVRILYSGSATTGNKFVGYVVKDLSSDSGKTLRIKASWSATGSSIPGITLGLCDSSAENRSLLASLSTSGETTSVTIPTFTDTSTYLYIYLYINRSSSATLQPNDTVDFTDPIITIDNADMSYEDFTGNLPAPNPSYPFPIKSVTGNNNVVVHNNNFLDNTIYNTIDRNGSATLQPNGYYLVNFPVSKTIMEGEFEENTQYAMSCVGYGNTSGNNGVLKFNYTDNTSSAQGISGTTPNSFSLISTAGKTIKNIEFTFGSGYPTYIKDLMLEKNSVVTPYVAHQEVTKPLNLGTIELNKIGTYQDYIYKSGDKWYKKEQVGKVVFTGGDSENWLKMSADLTNTIAFALANSVTPAQTPIGLCNNFIQTTGWSYLISTDINMFQIYPDKATYIRINSTLANDVASFKTWLSTHNTEIKYALATPNDIEITDTTLISQLEEIDKMKSYEGTTIITSTFDSNNAQMIISASGLKGE